MLSKYYLILIGTIFVFCQIFASDKTSIAVLELNAEGVSLSEARIISDRLRTDLFRTDKFIVLEREKMNDILKEQGFQQIGCTTNECAVEIGKLIGVEKIVAGYIGKLGKLHTLNIRFIDVESGEVTRTATEDCNCAIEDILTISVNNIAKQLAGQEKKEIKNPPTRGYTSYFKSIYLEPRIGVGFGDISSDKMAIGCIISKDFPRFGRIGINYLTVKNRSQNITILYEYSIKDIINILPQIGLGYIYDKYRNSTWNWPNRTAKSEGLGMLLGISIEKFLNSFSYIRLGYDGYINLHSSKKRSKNGAILISFGFKVF